MCCFVVVLGAICLLSLEADAQPTVDETTSCASSTSTEVLYVVKMNAEEIKEVKKLIASNKDESPNQAHFSAQNLMCECLIAEYWKHSVERFNDVHAFGYNSAGSDGFG